MKYGRARTREKIREKEGGGHVAHGAPYYRGREVRRRDGQR